MTEYRVIFDDPAYPDEPTRVLCPAPEWMEQAMAGNFLPPIEVFWAIQEDEQKAIDEGRHSEYRVPDDLYMAQFTSPRIPALTEEEAIEYLILKDIPRRVWGQKHNRQMFKVVKLDDLPKDRIFRDAWRME